MGKVSKIFAHEAQTPLLVLLLMTFTTSLWADIPASYYDAASGKTGDALKIALNDIIDGHTEYPYTSSGTDVWDILKESDRDPNNSSNVICIYTRYSVDAAQEYNSGNGWSREHVWAKSHGDFGTTTGTGTDLHNLKPEDVSVNSTRNNKDFEDGGSQVTDSSPPTGYSGTLDCYDTSTTFEPPDDVKGDVARIIFYMVTRYEGENGEVDLEMVDYADSAPNLEPYHGVESTLYEWHAADPVDDFERNRNDVIYNYQGNRNPFIDHPEYVDRIWNEEEDCSGDLIITGVYDGPRTGGTPKGVEVYVLNNILDLSIYGLGSANNGDGSDGQEFTFPAASASAGDYIHVAYESTEFTNWFGSSPDYTSGSMGINGDDAIELYCDGVVVDVYGDINTDGNGEVWEYLDGWAYSKDNRTKTTTFNSQDWTFSGANALDGETYNATASSSVPVGTFKNGDSSLPVELSAWYAISDKGSVELNWVTDSEIENQGFIIERAIRQIEGVKSEWADIASFTTHPELLGQGSTSSQSTYTFVDNQVKVGETYRYLLSDVDYRGKLTSHHAIELLVKDSPGDVKPPAATLHPAYPNPFNPDVNLSFTLERETDALRVEVYDIQGTLVRTLASGHYESGTHTLHWKGNDNQGNVISSGVFMIRLNTNSTIQIQRVTLLR